VTTRHDYPIAAIPHDTPRYPLGPTAVPGTYKVQLTVDGKTMSAPLAIKMDPRVKISATSLEKKFQAEMKASSMMTESAQALLQGGSVREQLEKLRGQASASTLDAIEASEKKLSAVLGAAGGFLAPPTQEATLSRVNGEAGTIYQAVWQADAEPTSSQMAALTATEEENADIEKRWNEFKNAELPALNRLLRDSKVPEVQPQADLHREDSQEDEE